ncbi:hypothetical protein NXC12_PD00324 (plasmid) [Rhizobium etli]|uniref:Uncharacterized protein n=1 Tax=Rhizobium etli TaxID=29449 RepID=A0AAN1BLW1_RHIET|nr:hypothetical protein NXC12_PD00324 [Rhizobium etli]
MTEEITMKTAGMPLLRTIDSKTAAVSQGLPSNGERLPNFIIMGTPAQLNGRIRSFVLASCAGIW